ncbi:hypothetical protein [Vogesella sp. LIG4]|uniref:COG4315 family predicted lipoprotein n=1 Tax=Vogesella sp. LIG4 TaxID=1192162 RepID=UPI00081F8999|nr:hypothetical protein [Vogesella sp. LIG4]SCK06977.1 Uncharacterized protein conserved in bacteria [Vogesella sp. LIG4]
MNRSKLLILLTLGLLSGCAGYGYHEHMHEGMGGGMEGDMHAQHDGMMDMNGQMMGAAFFRQGMLVAQGGRTLYRFDRDQPGSGVSSCNDGCSAKWPPYLAPPGATAQGPLGLLTRSDGSKQWTFRGSPLYFWSGDQKAGDMMGDNFASMWHVIRP